MRKQTRRSYSRSAIRNPQSLPCLSALLAFPGATIYTFGRTPPARVAYEDLEHVNLTRAFLTAPEAYLRHLIVDP